MRVADLDLRVLKTLQAKTAQEVLSELRRSYKGKELVLAVDSSTWIELSTMPIWKLVNLTKDHAELLVGKVGTLLGLPLVTDAYSENPKLPLGFSICELRT